MLIDTQRQMDGLGDATDSLNGNQQGAVLLRMLSNFAAKFSDAIAGKGNVGGETVEMSELYGGARISFIFNDVFGRRLKALDPFEGLDDEDIRTAIANANGPRPSLFVPEQSFDLLVRRQVARLEQPGLQCVDLVFNEMQRMALQSESPELTRFPELRDRLFEIVNASLRSQVYPTQKMISNLIQIELAYINTNHPDFIGGKQAVAQLNRKLSEQRNSSSNGSSSSSSSNGGGKGVSAADENTMPPPTPGADVSGNAAPVTPSGTGAVGGPGYFNLFRPNSGRASASKGSNAADGGLVKLPQVTTVTLLAIHHYYTTKP
jgi:dynamin 1-like protein